MRNTRAHILVGSIIALLAAQAAQASMLIPGTRVGSSDWGANESVNQLFSWANPILGQPDPGINIDTSGHAWDSANEVNLIAWFDFGARYTFTALDFATQNNNDGFNRAKLWISDSLSNFTVTNGNTAPGSAPDLNVVLSGAGNNFAQYALPSSVSARYVVAQFLSERVANTVTFHPRAWELRMEGTLATASAYWTGTTDNLWSVPNNFATVQSGAPNLTGALDSFTDVIFNANVTANFANTQLGGNQTIHSLTFGSNATTPVGIGGGDTLTITPIQPTIGVTVQTLSGDHTIGSNVALGADQRWTVTDASQTLAVSGAVGGATKAMTKAGAGALDLTGAVTLGTMIVSAGTASLGAASSGAITTLNVSSSGTASLAAGSTAAVTTMNVSSGTASATVSGGTVATLNASAGTTTLGAAVTTLNVSGTGALLGAAGAAATTATVTGGTIDTQGNYLSVADRINMTGGNIVASGAAFGVKGSSITPNLTTIGELKLDGGTVTVNMTQQQVMLGEDFDSMGAGGTTLPTNWSIQNVAGGAGDWGAGGITFSGVTVSPTSGVLTVNNTPTGNNINGYNASGAGASGRSVATAPTSDRGVAIQSPQILNNSGGPLSAIDISYDIKRFGASANSEENPGYWLFYSLDGTTWTNVSGLNPTITNTPPNPNVPNSAGTTSIATTTVTLSSAWNNGTNLRLRWADDNSTSSPEQVVGLDNVMLKVNTPGPVNLPTTDLVATSNTTLDLGFAGAATVRDVNLGSGIALTVQTATSLSMNALTGVAGSQLLASGMGLTVASGSDAGSITAASVTKTSTGVLQLDGAQTYGTLTVEDGTLNVNGSLTTGTAAVSVTDTAGGAPTTLRFGSVSQTLSSLSIGAGATVVFTSGTATGAFSGGGKAPGFGGSAAVPEPGTVGLLIVGALGVLARRRRRVEGTEALGDC